MKYLLTGGGTGGHVYPALAIREELKECDPESLFLYVGVRGRAEARLVPPLGIRFTTVSSRGFPGKKNPIHLAAFSVSLLFGILKALCIIVHWKPDVIVATGGYVSAPVVFASEVLRRFGIKHIPVLIHEQNAIPGRMNRISAQWARCIAVSYPSTAAYLPKDRTLVLGYPVRKSVHAPPEQHEARTRLGIPRDAEVLLIFGGSLGARSINKGLAGALPSLLSRENLYILHGTGRGGGKRYDPVKEMDADLSALSRQPDPTRYRRFEYLDPISNFYAAADVVVSRAGAGTLNELSSFGKPALLIPKANLPGDHQVRNAIIFQNAGAADVMYEEPVRSADGIVGIAPSEKLAARIVDLLRDTDRRKRLSMRIQELAVSNASSRIAAAVIELGRGRYPSRGSTDTIRWPEPDQTISRYARLRGSELLAAIKVRISNGIPLKTEEERYLRYRTDGYLASDLWEDRNIGVKLAGMTGRSDRTSLLASMVTEKCRKRSIIARVFNLTHRENDFIRRNAITALGDIGELSREVTDALIHGLHDTYYEIRSAAAQSAAKLAGTNHLDERIHEGVHDLLRDRWFEVRVSALGATGEIARDASCVPDITAFFTAENWKVRNAAVRAIARMIERGVLDENARETIREELGSILLTTTDFKPMFELKRSLVSLSDSLKEI